MIKLQDSNPSDSKSKLHMLTPPTMLWLSSSSGSWPSRFCHVRFALFESDDMLDFKPLASASVEPVGDQRQGPNKGRLEVNMQRCAATYAVIERYTLLNDLTRFVREVEGHEPS
jgi:hypothetical protein